MKQVKAQFSDQVEYDRVKKVESLTLKNSTLFNFKIFSIFISCFYLYKYFIGVSIVIKNYILIKIVAVRFG